MSTVRRSAAQDPWVARAILAKISKLLDHDPRELADLAASIAALSSAYEARYSVLEAEKTDKDRVSYTFEVPAPSRFYSTLSYSITNTWPYPTVTIHNTLRWKWSDKKISLETKVVSEGSRRKRKRARYFTIYLSAQHDAEKHCTRCRLEVADVLHYLDDMAKSGTRKKLGVQAVFALVEDDVEEIGRELVESAAAVAAKRAVQAARAAYYVVEACRRLSIRDPWVPAAEDAVEEARQRILEVYSEVVETLKERDAGRAHRLLGQRITRKPHLGLLRSVDLDDILLIVEGARLPPLCKALHIKASWYLRDAVVSAARSRAAAEVLNSLSEVE